MRLVATALALLAFAAPALAQSGAPPLAKPQSLPPAAFSGGCDLGQASGVLDVSDVRARLFNTGSLFFGNGFEAEYVIPQSAGISPLYTASLWVGGRVDGGRSGSELRTAGATYRNFEFWPGPLDDDGEPPANCAAFDRIYVVSSADVQAFEDTGEATPDLAAWPVGLGAPTVDASGDPITSDDRDRVIDLGAGERPVVYGTQTAFWVMNDAGGEHQFTDTEPIGLEVRVTAFAVVAEPLALYQGTFYRYKFVNRSSQPLTDVYVSLFTDPDLGDAGDDYIGSDSTRGLGFVYNGQPTDGVYGVPPALGLDFLTGAHAASFFINGGPPGISDPLNGEDLYNYQQGLWRDGTPMTEGWLGYRTSGDTTTWIFPGDPVTEQFWSEVNTNGEGGDNPLGDRRLIVSSEPFGIVRGGSHTVDLAILFAQGDGNLDSITELRAASDEVQALYDAGDLFVPFPPFEDPEPLATPALIAPADGAAFENEGETVDVPFEWTAVDGASRYILEVDESEAFDSPFGVVANRGTERAVRFVPPFFTETTYFWHVRAEDGPARSSFTKTRSFTATVAPTAFFSEGRAIVESARPGGPVCPGDTDDIGCAFDLGGNTVWLDPNADADYVLTNPENDFRELTRYFDAVGGDDFEVRFTDACADAGSCLGIYASAAPGRGGDFIASVPFELWNTGLDDGAADDIRMIPLLRAADTTDVAVSAWADTFPTTQPVVVDTTTLSLPVTHRIIPMMPDRPSGYDLFADAALGFGGPGATYIPDEDGDTQEEIFTNPVTGSEQTCRSQRYYVAFCYRNLNNRFVAPFTGLSGVVFADLAGDGTTPPPGTTVRFVSANLPPVANEDDAPDDTGQPTMFALGTAYPNPFASSSTVPFELAEAGRVRLAVYDVLGREVAVLAEGERSAGPHTARLDGSRLATGVYLVVLEAEGQRETQKVMLLR